MFTRPRQMSATLAAIVVGCVFGVFADRPGAQAPAGSPGPAAGEARQGGAAGQPGGPAGDGRAGRGGGRQGGGGRGGAAAIPFEDQTGFKAIFDGKSLAGWDGDPGFWRVENGAMVGESTPEKVVKPNTFMSGAVAHLATSSSRSSSHWSAATPACSTASVEMPEVAKWVLKGYQADIDFNNQYTGMLYEERGRARSWPAGSAWSDTEGPSSRRRDWDAPLAALEDGEALQTHIKQNDWNSSR